MWKYFTANNTYAYLKALSKLLSSYNHSYHRSIKTIPTSVNIHSADHAWRTLYGADVGPTRTLYFKFNVGDTVRISMAARPFRKDYLPNWTTEFFTVSAKIHRYPPVYKIKDYDGEEVDGTFYEQELQRVIKTDDMYQVEKVLDNRKRVDYPDKFNSWVTELHTF